MGKRKSSRKPVAKVKTRLPTVFNCPYCNHEKSIEVKLDKPNRIGTVKCRVCHETWQTNINALSAPVDVYSDWIDACEAAQTQHEEEATYRGSDSAGRAGGAGHADEYDDEDDGYGRPTAANNRSSGGYRDYDDEDEDDYGTSSAASRRREPVHDLEDTVADILNDDLL
ncbi:hypothetical protein H9P43_007178 [Blastocladiella emersonii ATCC 22665]|nr:hypothetical protein H9P43_007178 [Blastocladiella emersonii ATCC 22665]